MFKILKNRERKIQKSILDQDLIYLKHIKEWVNLENQDRHLIAREVEYFVEKLEHDLTYIRKES